MFAVVTRSRLKHSWKMMNSLLISSKSIMHSAMRFGNSHH